MSDTRQIYSNRRKNLLGRIGSGVAVIPTARHALRNRDTHYPFRFDSHFYYLTGFAEPEAVLVLIGGKSPQSILFCREKDIEKEIWDGIRLGPDLAREKLLVDEAHCIDLFEEMLPNFLSDQDAVFYPVGADRAMDEKILSALNSVKSKIRNGISAPSEIRDVRALLDEMRLFKDLHEISLMKKAAEISAQAHRDALKIVSPGMMEYEVEAHFLREFRRHGAQSPAYPTIAASGKNACILHYVENDAELKNGEMILIDAGCEFDGYASDITRTFPVNGKFSPAQKDMYEIVLCAQKAALEQTRPGNPYNLPHDAAITVISQGLIDMGFCQGSLDSVIETGDYKRFYMHKTGHWLGLDVHDVGEYKKEGNWRSLEAGMTLTIEPGCYIRPDESIPPEFWNMGIRIEDNVRVTEEGHEILTDTAPKSVADIEKWMKN